MAKDYKGASSYSFWRECQKVWCLNKLLNFKISQTEELMLNSMKIETIYSQDYLTIHL